MAEPKVLVVDDDTDVRRLVCRALDRAGLACLSAGDGEEALAVLADATGEIDVVVLDWHLPGISGLEVLEHIRAQPSARSVIVFTGEASEGDRADAMEGGADEYVVKSAGISHLVERVAAARAVRTKAAGDGSRSIAHELHNVFTIISGYTDLVMTSMADADHPLDRRAVLDDLQTIADAGTRGASLAGRLMGTDATPTPSATDPPSRTGRGETILLVEDDDDLRRAMERILADQGYTVLSAGDTEAAMSLHRAMRGSIDLVLSDAIVPGSDPGAVVTRLASSDPDLPVLVVSGYGEALRDLAPALGEDVAILDKPFTTEGLLAGVRRALDGTAPR